MFMGYLGWPGTPFWSGHLGRPGTKIGPLGRAWAVGQARSPGQPDTVAQRAKLGPARSDRAGTGGPFAHLYLHWSTSSPVPTISDKKSRPLAKKSAAIHFALL